jgi:autotransporter strand-loop-strand O-heptosyltransferase
MKTFKDFIYEKINEDQLPYSELKFNVNSTIDGYVKVKEDDPSISSDNESSFDKLIITNPSDFYNLPLQKICSDILGLEYTEIKPKILENKKQVCLGIYGSGQLKYWNNPHGWQTVIDWLNDKGYAVKVLSSEGQKYNYYLNNVIFHPAGNIEYVIKELKESVAFIGVCSGLSWLSWAADTKTIIIDGYSSKLTFPKNCIHISPPADKCQGCYHKYKFNKDDWYFCPEHKGTDRQFECTKSITANMVIDKLKEIL